jgi:hypothetical protein
MCATRARLRIFQFFWYDFSLITVAGSNVPSRKDSGLLWRRRMALLTSKARKGAAVKTGKLLWT